MLSILPQNARAEIDNSTLDVVEDPICFVVRNTADYGVNGSISTAQFMRPDGVVSRHKSNFRFKAAGSVDAEGLPDDWAEFCSYGPFLPDRQVILTLRTLFPVFECKTRVDTGQEIVIKGMRREDDNGVQTWAECFNPDGTKTDRPDQ